LVGRSYGELGHFAAPGLNHGALTSDETRSLHEMSSDELR